MGRKGVIWEEEELRHALFGLWMGEVSARRREEVKMVEGVKWRSVSIRCRECPWGKEMKWV